MSQPTTAAAIKQREFDVKIYQNPKRPDIKGIEFHFPDEPPAEIKELLSKNGFNYLSRRRGQWEPRWFRAQCAESWRFAQAFCRDYSQLFGPALTIPDDAIPEEFRHAPEPEAKPPGAIAKTIAQIIEELPPIEEVEPEPTPAIAPEEPPQAETGDPEPTPPPVVDYVLDLARSYLVHSSDSVTFGAIAADLFGGGGADDKANDRLQQAFDALIARGDLAYNGSAYTLPPLPPEIEAMTDAELVAALAPEEEEPVPEPDAPMPKKTPQSDLFAQLFDFADIIAELASETVEAADRKVKIWAWKPEWPGGMYRWFTVHLALTRQTIEAAIAVAEGAAEITSAKKTKPTEAPKLQSADDAVLRQPAPSVAPVETVVPPAPKPAPSLPADPKPAAPPKTRKTKKSAKPTVIRTVTKNPIIEGDPIFLDDDELRGTEGYPGCYADLDGQVGLSFKGLVEPVTFEVGKVDYEALPGTFQPLTMEEFAADRLKAMLVLREAYVELIDAEADPSQCDEFVSDCRQVLNQLYDKFVLEHGRLVDNEKLTNFYGLTDHRLIVLLSLEVKDPDTSEIQKADLFFRRCVHPAGIPTGQVCFQDDMGARCYAALLRSLAITGGVVNLPLIAELAGAEQEEVEEQLLKDRHIGRDPDISGSGHRGTM